MTRRGLTFFSQGHGRLRMRHCSHHRVWVGLWYLEYISGRGHISIPEHQFLCRFLWISALISMTPSLSHATSNVRLKWGHTLGSPPVPPPPASVIHFVCTEKQHHCETLNFNSCLIFDLQAIIYKCFVFRFFLVCVHKVCIVIHSYITLQAALMSWMTWEFHSYILCVSRIYVIHILCPF